MGVRRSVTETRRECGLLIFLLIVLLRVTECADGADTGYVYASPLVGSGGTGFGSGGHNPGAQCPFGALRVGPDSALKVLGFDLVSPFDHYGGYNFEDNQIRAFSHTHLVGAGVGDFGNFGFMPLVTSQKLPDSELQNILTTPRGHTSKFSHSEEFAEPGYYRVLLEKPASSLVELGASSTHTGSHKYTWLPASVQTYSCGFMIDVCHTAMGDGKKACKNATIRFSRVNPSTLHVEMSLKMAGALSKRSTSGGVDVFLSANVHMPSSARVRFWKDGKLLNESNETSAESDSGSLGMYVWTACSDAAASSSSSLSVGIDVGLSFVSLGQADINVLNMGVKSAPPSSFVAVRESAESIWKPYFSSINISTRGLSPEFLTKFYSALYNSYKAPTTFSEYGGRYLGMDGKIHVVGEVSNDKRSHAYTDMSLWDTHRTQFPWLSFQVPGVYKDVIASIQDMGRTGGDLPRWPLANVYTGCMIGSHGMVSIAESIVKGQAEKLDLEFIFELMNLSASVPRPHGGRQHVEDYARHGFVPFDDTRQAASLTLAYAFDDSAVATVANRLGLKLEHEFFSNRSMCAYKSLWSPSSKLLCPRFKNGTLKCPTAKEAITPYPFEKDYVEGDALQWLWFVPHDPQGLVHLFGNNETYVSKLDDFIANSRSPKEGGKWKYGTALANGWYWAGNEPDLLAPWLFPFAGAQNLTAYWTRWLVRNAYTARGKSGLPGNDDFGTMSSWFLWASLGFYPLAGTGDFIIGSPSMENATLYRAVTHNMSDVMIVAHGASTVENTFVQCVRVNGKNRTDPFLHWKDDLLRYEGGVPVPVDIVFWLGPRPCSTWCSC